MNEERIKVVLYLFYILRPTTTMKLNGNVMELDDIFLLKYLLHISTYNIYVLYYMQI